MQSLPVILLSGSVLRLTLSTAFPSLCTLLESRTELSTPLLSWLRRTSPTLSKPPAALIPLPHSPRRPPPPLPPFPLSKPLRRRLTRVVSCSSVVVGPGGTADGEGGARVAYLWRVDCGGRWHGVGAGEGCGGEEREKVVGGGKQVEWDEGSSAVRPYLPLPLCTEEVRSRESACQFSFSLLLSFSLSCPPR
jgi:hypothetical protein